MAAWLELLGHLEADALPPGVKALGLTRQGREAAVLLVLEPHALRAFSAPALGEMLAALPLGGMSVVVREIPGALRATAYLPAAQQEALTPEQDILDPVVLGAQLQNGSADLRLGGYGAGTLGAFAADAEGRVVLLSNNHVIAAESAPGDSGSGDYDLRGRLLGFLYAGDGVITLACPAEEAVEALNITALTV